MSSQTLSARGVQRKILLLSLGALTLSAFACALNKAGTRDVRELLGRFERERGNISAAYGRLTRRVAATQAAQPSTQPAGGSVFVESGLAGLIALALERNPEIQAAIETAQSRANRISQETALPDPMLSTKTLPTPLALADGNQYFVLGVDQEFPAPEKLDRRGRVALAEVRMALQELRRVQQRVIAELKRAYFEMFVIDRTIDLTEENKSVLRDLVDVARAELTAGRRGQQDVLRAEVEFLNLERELIDLRQRRLSTLALINSLLDRPSDMLVQTPALYDVRRIEPRFDYLLARAMRENPELARLQRQIERDEQSVRLARLAYWPEFRLGFEWMSMQQRDAFVPPRDPFTGVRPAVNQASEMGGDMWAINFGFSLPIWYEKIEAGIREARHALAASRQEFTAAKNTLAYRVQDGLARVRAQRELVDLLADAIIPQARQAYEVSRLSYSAGTVDFQFLIENWQVWLDLRTQYYRALGELERAIADLEQAVGVSVVEAQVGESNEHTVRQRQ